MKSRNVDVKSRCHQLTRSGFIAEQRFRNDLAAVANTSKHWRGWLCQPGKLQILINTGRRAYRARHGSPYCLRGSRRPQQPRAGLAFPASEDVVLKLRPYGQPEFVLQDRDLVLHECTVDIVVFTMRQKVEGSDSLDEIAGTPSSSKPPDNFISLLEDEVVNQVNVKGVASFSQLRSETICPVIISLDLDVRRTIEFAAPAPQEITARYVLRPVYVELTGWRVRRDGHLLPNIALIKIALNCERIAVCQLGVRSETRLSKLPGVIVTAAGVEFGGLAKSHGVRSIVEIISVSATVANSALVLFDISDPGGCVGSASVLGTLSNDVDHAIDRVRSPDRSPGPPNPFDTRDILEQHILHVPVHAGIKRCIDASAVNQYQH